MNDSTARSQTDLLGAAGSILIINGDSAALRVVEIALAAKSHQVIACLTSDAAWRKLEEDVVDLVLSEVSQPGVDGIALLKRIRANAKHADLPFVFLSSDRRPSVRISALEQGADDYVVRPCVGDELQAKVSSLLRRSRRSKVASAGGEDESVGFAGQLTAIRMEEIMQFMEMSRKTGLLHVTSERATARVNFDKGQIHSASFADIEGEEAIFLLFSLQQGRFEFRPGVEPAGTRNVSRNCAGLLLEGLRQLDETKRAIEQSEEERERRTADSKRMTPVSDAAPAPAPGASPKSPGTVGPAHRQGASDKPGPQRRSTQKTVRRKARVPPSTPPSEPG